MEIPKGKTDWSKVGLGAGITIAVIIVATVAYELRIKPVLAGTKEEQRENNRVYL